MGLLNRIKCCGKPPSARLILAARWISPCPASAICTWSAVFIWAPRHVAAARQLLKDPPGRALIVEADIGGETPFTTSPPVAAGDYKPTQLLNCRSWGESGLYRAVDSQPLGR